ncbi:alpha/beta-hydrolase [Phlegmacium glaucopus]|nr:alpha/beta-hydrolase [Phlegmacium glaucopus]
MACPNCVEGEFLPGEPTGSINSDFQGAYYAPRPGDETSASKRTVLLLTDAFGLPLKNCRIMADELAKRLDCDVWIPDYFAGKPLFPVDAMKAPGPAGVKVSFWDWLRLLSIIIPRLPNLLLTNRSSVTDRRLHSFINLLKETKKYEKIGAVGYCFGGSSCVRLGGANLVNSIVICHPGRFTIDQVKAINIPTAWICAEEDMFFPDSLRLASEAVFAERKDKENYVDYELKVYNGTTHGFAARANLQVPELKKAHEDAFDQTVEWFKKTLVV